LLENTNIVRRSILEEEANTFAIELLFDCNIEEYIKNPDINIKVLEELNSLIK
jgi:Zn-dependent peptidase ImmA (M78 family)